MTKPSRKPNKLVIVILCLVALSIWGFNLKQLFPRENLLSADDFYQLDRGLNLQERMDVLKQHLSAPFNEVLWDPFLTKKPGVIAKSHPKKAVKKKRDPKFHLSYIGMLEDESGQILFILGEGNEFHFLHLGDYAGIWKLVDYSDKALLFKDEVGVEKQCVRRK